MSQSFRLKFDEMQESNPAIASDNNTSDNDLYDTPGHVRNLCFVWPDGKMKFLNYAYLLSGKFDIEGVIVLIFTTENIVLKGTNLNILFQ